MAMAPSTVFGYLVYKRVLIAFILISVLVGIDGDGELEKKMLHAHNEYRKMHTVDRLHLSRDLNEKAMQCALHYHAESAIDHSCPHKRTETNKYGILGENLYMSWDDVGVTDEQIILKAVDGWYAEVEDYDFATGEKKATSKEEAVTGHFTQMVWKTSKYLGVALYKELDIAIVVCLYDPPGNLKNNYVDNVNPEDKSEEEPVASKEHEHKHQPGDPDDSNAVEQREARARKHRMGHHEHRTHGKSSRLPVSWGYMVYLILALCVSFQSYQI